jgi:hypothetical protein
MEHDGNQRLRRGIYTLEPTAHPLVWCTAESEYFSPVD